MLNIIIIIVINNDTIGNDNSQNSHDDISTSSSNSNDFEASATSGVLSEELAKTIRSILMDSNRILKV